MKKWNRVLALLLAMGLAAGLCACHGTTNRKSEKSLYEHGLDVVALIQKMAGSEEHIILSHYPSTGDDLVSPLASMNLSNPEHLYQIKVTKDGYLKDTAPIFELAGLDTSVIPDDIPSDLWEMVESPRANTALLRYLYSVGGDWANYEIADYHTDAFTATKIFVNHELAENMVYLYIFRDTAIAVAFNKGEDGAVLATGKPILIDEILNATPSDIERALTYGEGYSYVEVKDITP